MYRIYRIFNLINGKFYIGQTCKSIKRRLKIHINATKILNTHLARAIKKYGKDNFYIEEIDSCDEKKEADYLERWYIRFYNTTNDKVGYNMTEGGEGTVGYKMSDATKKKLSDGRKGKKSWTSKPVLQYSLDGNFIKKYDYIKQVYEELGILGTNISRVCLGKKQSIGGYIWKHYTKNFKKKIPSLVDNRQYSGANNPNSRGVDKYDLNGNYIESYSYVKLASIKTGISKRGIGYCCIGKQQSSGGFIWKYSDKNST